MSDLYIEARLKAIRDIASVSCTDIKDADNIAGFCDEIYDAIPKLDKIVEELELHSFELGTDTLPVHYVRLNEAIEIVKQGGIRAVECQYSYIDEEVSNNMCEWRQTSTARYKTSCGYHLVEFFDTKACYCKQCGKKIKILGD